MLRKYSTGRTIYLHVNGVVLVREAAWYVRLYGEIIPKLIDRTGAQTMLIGTIISSIDLAHYGVSRAKDWVSMDCGTN